MKTHLVRQAFSLLAPEGPRGRLSTLLFHKVPYVADPLTPGEFCLEQFDGLMAFLQRYFRVLPLAEAARAVQKGTLPERAVAISFDDGYADWLTGVSEVLTRRNLPATFFITTEQFAGPALWHERVIAAVRELPDFGALLPPGFGHLTDLRTLQSRITLVAGLQDRFKYVPLPERLAAIEALEAQAIRPLVLPERFTVDSVKALHAKGFDVGAHTVRHPILNKCSLSEARDEIGSCREELSAALRAPVELFAYPNGRFVTDYSLDHVELVRQCGYSAAVSTDWGVARRGDDIWQLPRFTPWAKQPWLMGLQLARNLRSPPMRQASQTAMVDFGKQAREEKRPLRVLYVENGAGFGGAVVALETTLSALDPARVEARVVCNFPVGRFAEQPVVRSVRVISDRRFDVASRVATLKQHPRAYYGWRRAALFLAGRLDDIVNRGPYLVALLREIARYRPDVVHGNNLPSSNREAIVAAWLSRLPYVQHLRGELWSGGAEQWLLKQPAAYVPVSQWLAESLVEKGVARQRIVQIYDGLPAALPAVAPYLRNELNIPSSSTLVALIGMLVPWKGQRLFIEAVTRLSRQTDACFLMIGGTPENGDLAYAQFLEVLLEERGLRDRVRMLGLRHDVAQLLPELDVVVSASQSPEPLGLVMLEGMRAGAVFVGPRHGAAIEVVQSQQDGYLFTPNDAEAFAAALEQAIAAVPARAVREEVARRIAAEFSAPSQARRIEALYRV
ncbi:MAG: glycosyltransferase [Rhodocyclales bacterium]|nr:glycosyltransferase [Rhodocyclales bacterium]